MSSLAFLYNPTSWRAGRPVPGGMADALVQPILEHLDVPWQLTDRPQPDAVNVYYAHRAKYRTSREPGLSSVFVSHGIADKGWRNADRMRGQFNWVVVSGPAWSRRLAHGGFPPGRIIEAGYPKLDPLFQGRTPVPPRDGRIRVVWAPTHGGGGDVPAPVPAPRRPQMQSTWGRGAELLGLLEDFDVVVAPHPRHRDDGRSTLCEYVGADVVIADGGSTIYEAWALDLPVVFCSWLTGDGNQAGRRGRPTFESLIYRRRLGYHADRPEELAEVVARAADQGIGDAEHDLIEEIFPRRYRGVSGRLHAEALADVARARTRPRHLADPHDINKEATVAQVTVRSPNPAYDGVSYGVQFSEGVAQVDDADERRLAWFVTRGYQVASDLPAPSAPAADSLTGVEHAAAVVAALSALTPAAGETPEAVPPAGDVVAPKRNAGRDAWAAYAEHEGVVVTDEMSRDDIIAAVEADEDA